MSSVEDFGLDPIRYKFGSICKRGHNWNETGHSLRRVGKGDCVDCMSLRYAEHYRANRDKKLSRSKQRYLEKREERRQKAKEDYRANAEKYRQMAKDARLRNLDKYLAQRKAYRLKNREKILQQQKDSYKLNPEARKLASARWRKQNPEKVKEIQRQYLQTERGRFIHDRANSQRRALKQLGAAYPFSRQEIDARFAQFENSCAYCGLKDRVTIDHFIPIDAGGSDCIGNIVPCCKWCNCSKKNRDPREWYSRQEFFSDKRWQRILRVLGKNQNNYNQIPLL